MEKCIEGAKSLIEHQIKNEQICNVGESFAEYQKVYAWTNEYIKGYLDLVSFTDKDSALSVMASGDHAFNLIEKGISIVDTFDTNRLTEYYALGLKRAMILKYDYNTFLNVTQKLYSDNITIEEISEIVLGLLPFMDSKYANYWRQIIDFNMQMQRNNHTKLNLFRMLNFANNFENMNELNNYLVNEEHYERLRNRMGTANINFKCANAMNLESEFNSQYDFILLSNILAYFSIRWKFDWDYEEFKKYEDSLKKILKPEGIIFLKYIMLHGITDKMVKTTVIGNHLVTSKDLTDEEIINLPPLPGNKAFSGMVLLRKKK